jgi:uncharacterized protein (DUF58 family)
VLPARIETIILALDMSGSMRATDLEPTRIVAAQNAAKAFVEAQPRHVKVGVVGIAASAALVQTPTDNREQIIQALTRLEPQRGTALGSGPGHRTRCRVADRRHRRRGIHQSAPAGKGGLPRRKRTTTATGHRATHRAPTRQRRSFCFPTARATSDRIR